MLWRPASVPVGLLLLLLLVLDGDSCGGHVGASSLVPAFPSEGSLPAAMNTPPSAGRCLPALSRRARRRLVEPRAGDETLALAPSSSPNQNNVVKTAPSRGRVLLDMLASQASSQTTAHRHDSIRPCASGGWMAKVYMD
ncbi:hypothetical protein EJ03DRAFT_165061 [Teratosphaeria nubilosa]|uniref:Uncharacterized protein n=1 Tax=Teratosphaeria nubilosa TaxID=161662 RepID=A0A6G1L2Q8_9PEZI|nr:hypothetical protein EJ03DRAFT_165061 [Teratosphaeria nubilosa]